jgi:hypothetical protein
MIRIHNKYFKNLQQCNSRVKTKECRTIVALLPSVLFTATGYRVIKSGKSGTTVICTNQGGRNKYYQIIDGNVICTTRNASTGLCTTSANWNKYYHLPRTGLCTTALYWIMT